MHERMCNEKHDIISKITKTRMSESPTNHGINALQRWNIKNVSFIYQTNTWTLYHLNRSFKF